MKIVSNIMETRKSLPKFSFLVMLMFGNIDGFPWQQDTPVCTSHDKLCDVSFEVTNPWTDAGFQSVPSNIPMCRCPGSNRCPNGKRDSSRVIYQEMTSSGMSVNTKLSYCDAKSTPNRYCKHGEVAMTMRGFGPVMTDVVGGLQCKCREPLRLKMAYPDGMLSVRQYVCGQKTCEVNSNIKSVCERVIPGQSGTGRVTEIPCQCPVQFYCNVNGMGLNDGNRPVNFYCEPVQQWRK